MGKLSRIIWHWTAGGSKASATDRRHYHFIIEGDGTVVRGNHAPEANRRIAAPNDSSTYAAHVAGLNTGSIGISLCGMRNAVERPFTPGPSPITRAQIDALVTLTAELCKKYDIPVMRETTLSHAEVQPTLKVNQRGKWDITWLPGRTGPGDPVEIGDKLRAKVREAMKPVQDYVIEPLFAPNIFVAEPLAVLRDEPEKPKGFWAAIKRFFGG